VKQQTSTKVSNALTGTEYEKLIHKRRQIRSDSPPVGEFIFTAPAARLTEKSVYKYIQETTNVTGTLYCSVACDYQRYTWGSEGDMGRPTQNQATTSDRDRSIRDGNAANPSHHDCTVHLPVMAGGKRDAPTTEVTHTHRWAVGACAAKPLSNGSDCKKKKIGDFHSSSSQ